MILRSRLFGTMQGIWNFFIEVLPISKQINVKKFDFIDRPKFKPSLFKELKNLIL